ncbi:MAG: succinate dehydrogenase assembly factor 2 [Rhodanobacteraceae bacterium]
MSLPDTSRLRWRCRRGTRELDVLLRWWLDERYTMADSAAREDFAALLEAQDPDLWDWLIGHGEPDNPRLGAIVDEIRNYSRV